MSMNKNVGKVNNFWMQEVNRWANKLHATKINCANFKTAAFFKQNIHMLTSCPKSTSSDQVKKAAAKLVTTYKPTVCH